MKVVLFCGGKGLRLSEGAESTPKPMVPIGGEPILSHIMRYYAHYGHIDFVLCLGHKADVIEDYVRRELLFGPAKSNGRRWSIRFVDTGPEATIADRLRAARGYLDPNEIFLANYGDVLTDASLSSVVSAHVASDKVASFLCVRPHYTFNVVTPGPGGVVEGIYDVAKSGIWINGGYFVFRPSVFDYIRPGEDLVEEPFRRLIAQGQLLAYRHEGFWAPMDTLKDRERLEALVASTPGPWSVWENGGVRTAAGR